MVKFSNQWLDFFFSSGRTALHHAAMRNNYNNAKQLIQLGASIDVKIFYDIFSFIDYFILDIRWKKCYSPSFCMSI